MYEPGFRELFPSNNKFREEIVINYNILKVFGSGTVNVRPDKAEVSIGSTTENKQLKMAQKENTKITQQVIDSIKNVGIVERDIQTKDYNIRTKYDYIDGKQIFSGYEVTNYLKVIVTNINDVGNVIDTAVNNGANTVDNISFIVSDKSKYYNEALILAIEEAQNKALAIGNKLKININTVPIKIIEQGVGTGDSLSAITFKATPVITPIEVGENKIIASIEVIFRYIE